ncbi:MAG TPA: DUF454 family protein [Ignavibacteriaceae bacterium]|nr:DUF454 family protein [Ignavibacteriaceae bacterium]
MKKAASKGGIKKILYLLMGFIFLILGILGAIFPIVPGFIFLIPAVLCFAKASKTFNNWIRNSKYFKKYFGEHVPYKKDKSKENSL